MKKVSPPVPQGTDTTRPPLVPTCWGADVVSLAHGAPSHQCLSPTAEGPRKYSRQGPPRHCRRSTAEEKMGKKMAGLKCVKGHSWDRGIRHVFFLPERWKPQDTWQGQFCATWSVLRKHSVPGAHAGSSRGSSERTPAWGEPPPAQELVICGPPAPERWLRGGRSRVGCLPRQAENFF